MLKIKYLILAVQSKQQIMTQKLVKLKKKPTDHNQKDFLTKRDFHDKPRSVNQKLNSNKEKHLLVENELKKLKTCESSYFSGKSGVEEDGTQDYLLFQPIYRYFKLISNTQCISEWKSKRLSDKSIKFLTTSDNSLSPLIDYLGTKTRLEFNGLKQTLFKTK